MMDTSWFDSNYAQGRLRNVTFRAGDKTPMFGWDQELRHKRSVARASKRAKRTSQGKQPLPLRTGFFRYAKNKKRKWRTGWRWRSEIVFKLGTPFYGRTLLRASVYAK
jgi:hypothetical protein